MNLINIGCIVEGHGDSEAVPLLVRRLVAIMDPSLSVQILAPIRAPKSRLLRPGELERAIELVARKITVPGAILVLLDSDDQCPAEEGPTLLCRARSQRGDFRISVVLAKFEFEAWFLAAATSIRGRRGLSVHLEPPQDPESIRGAKGWLSSHMEAGRSYSAVLDQPAFTAIFDIGLARSAPSFDKCFRDVAAIVDELAPVAGA